MQSSNSAEATDPPLLRKHSQFRHFQTRFADYPSIRVFYKPHPQAEKIPNDPEPLPLLVFIHGLGGSLAQFNSVLSSLTNVAPCLGIDLPGCGRSKFAPKDWNSYRTEALVTLLDQVIEEYRIAQEGQTNRGVVLISHSMGCSLSTLLASQTSPYHVKTRDYVRGVIAICPKAEPPTADQSKAFRRLLWIPGPLFNIFRWWDRRGGVDSASVRRFVGREAGVDTRKLQLRFNAQSKTPVWRRMAWGCLPDYDGQGRGTGGLPGPMVWQGLKVPLCLIAGEADVVTKPEEAQIIINAIKQKPLPPHTVDDDPLPDASKLFDTEESPPTRFRSSDKEYGLQPTTTVTTVTTDSASLTNVPSETNTNTIRSTVLPFPASHGLLYDHATYRTVAGLIQDFLTESICFHLSLGWQLQHLTTSGKWDVKNLTKWQGVVPVSDPIGRPQPIFRALKTLRKQDEKHTPNVFVKEWHDKIYAIVDISHDSPTYDPAEIEAGGIQYHKFPTVSKIPPTVQEVQDFISLVERLRGEIDNKYPNSTPDGSSHPTKPVIAVHCHYGYNRTGFFIVSHLVEKQGYRLEDAIAEFGQQRPPGIRHDHFIDTLYVRYTVGLRRPGTGNDDEQPTKVGGIGASSIPGRSQGGKKMDVDREGDESVSE
ncbi:putative dual specificity phosphatase catalytic domain protein [Phaeomoniella chlamydospora]|uniref:Putative dual specificity phosphatase catalytic domain protein n=1 Tax=Phaeomoniella chlamydospora TaxID=158046 RepID=A0A0G2ESU9_PHACM|nr:putative dual specificity phosphatase catalytic domain protein [Phaeomoniella chlamydospora]